MHKDQFTGPITCPPACSRFEYLVLTQHYGISEHVEGVAELAEASHQGRSLGIHDPCPPPFLLPVGRDEHYVPVAITFSSHKGLGPLKQPWVVHIRNDRKVSVTEGESNILFATRMDDQPPDVP